MKKIENWQESSAKLRKRWPNLTESDLRHRHNDNDNELVQRIAQKVGATTAEVEKEMGVFDDSVNLEPIWPEPPDPNNSGQIEKKEPTHDLHKSPEAPDLVRPKPDLEKEAADKKAAEKSSDSKKK